MSTTDAVTTPQKLLAEFLGTFILVFGIVGAAMLSAGFNDGEGNLSIGFLGVALAIGLGLLIAAFAFGGTSGGHFNPAVSVGLVVAGRFPLRELPGYVLAQLLGGIAASSAVVAILGSTEGFAGAANGWGELSPGGFGLTSSFILETVAGFIFLTVILAVTGTRGAGPLAALPIGITLVVMSFVALPVSNASFNPARSLAAAVYAGRVAMGQVWLLFVAPTLGAIIAALVSRYLLEPRRSSN